MTTVLPAPPREDVPAERFRPRVLVRPVAHGVLALAVSALASLLVLRSFPDELRVRTDIVGYPVHQNFNVFTYFQRFYVLAVAFPVAALAVYHLLGRWRPRKPPPRRPVALAPSPSIDVDEADGPQPARYATGRLLFNGTVAGLALTYAVEPATHFWRLVGGAAVGFAVLAAAVAALRPLPLPGGGSFRARLSAVNALAVAGAVLALAAVSGVTRMTVLSDGTVDHVPFLPWWAAAPIAAAVVAVVGRALSRATSDVEVRRIERRALLVVAAPVGLFLVFATLSRPMGGLDLFHDGENLAAAHLVADGAFPWRDLFFIHGLMEDVVRPGLGMWLIQDSVWGYSAGHTLLFMPLFWIAHYALYVRLFGRNWLFLVLTVLLAFNGWLTPTHYRFLLQPVVLLLLAALLDKATKVRAAAFVLLAVVHLIVAPEAAFLVVAAAMVIVAFDTYYREPGQRLVERYRRTLWCAGFAAAALGAWFLFLAANGALGSFFFYYRTFGPGHALTGGIPELSEGLRYFRFAMLAPPVLALLTFGYVTARVRTRRPLAVEDWVMVTIALFLIAYYQKYLARADGHVFQVFAVTVPLLYYAVHKGVDGLERAIARRRAGERVLRATTRHPLTVALVLAAVLFAELHLDDRMQTAPANFHAEVPERPALERLGYSYPGAVKDQVVADVDKVLDATLRPGDRVFDMTNSPGLFYYLLDAEPVRRYYHVSMAMTAEAQEDLVRQLRRDRPSVITLGGPVGLPTWDGVPGFVRHYDVAEYVWRHYRPLLSVQGMLFLLRSDLPVPAVEPLAATLASQPVSTRDLLLNAETCLWGFAPNFLADPGGPPPSARGVDVPFQRGEGTDGHELVLSLPPGVRLDRFQRLEIETAEGLADDSFVLSADPAEDQRAIKFEVLERATRRYRVRVGSCPQWHAFAGAGAATLSLRHRAPQEVVAVRLLP